MTSNQARITSLIKAISGQANILTIPRIYISILKGSIETALFLSQCVYWSDRNSNPEGWFYKSYKDWEAELSMTQFRVKQAADNLKALGLLETKVKRANNAPTIHYRVNMDNLTDTIIKFLDNQEIQLSENLIINYEETSQSDYEETSQTLTETTIDHAKTTEIPAKTKVTRTPETQRASTLQAMANGINRDLGIKECIEKTFRINPNWDTKSAQMFLRWAKSLPPGQQFETFRVWWCQNDWRGKQGQPPSLAQIKELWPQAFTAKPLVASEVF